MIIRSGVPIVQGLEIIARASGNAIVAQAVESTAANVREGQSISASLSQNTLFPPMLWNMVAVGEQTGALEESLDKIADFWKTAEVGEHGRPVRLDPRTGDDRHRRRNRRLRRGLYSLTALAPAERDPLAPIRQTAEQTPAVCRMSNGSASLPTRVWLILRYQLRPKVPLLGQIDIT